MSGSANKIAIVALILGLSTAIARADGPPKLDVWPTCNAAAPYAIAVGRTKEACLVDEHAAESTLAENWSKYSAADKTQCIVTVNMGGPPSYVELLSCIEVLRDACDPDLAWLRPRTWAFYARPCGSRAQTDSVKKDGTVTNQGGARISSRDPAPGAWLHAGGVGALKLSAGALGLITKARGATRAWLVSQAAPRTTTSKAKAVGTLGREKAGQVFFHKGRAFQLQPWGPAPAGREN